MTDTLREDEQLVTVARYNFVPEAEVARMCLEEAGIPCVLHDKEIVSINWLMDICTGGIRLKVRESDATRAQEVLAATVEPTTDEEAMAGQETEEDSPATAATPDQESRLDG
jgi:hypothetical protein